VAIAFGSISTVATVASGNLTLNAPSSGAEGNLYVAVIGYRGTADFTLPSGWNLVAQQTDGDTDSTDGIASAVMAWIIRGASEPSFVFTRTAGDVATGYVMRFTGSFDSNSLDKQTSATAGSIAATVVATGFTTTAASHIVGFLANGDNDTTMTSLVAATNPTTTTERADSGSNTGADVHVGAYEAAGPTAGATGNFTGTQGAADGRMAIIVAAFKEAGEATIEVDAALAAQVSDLDGTVGVIIEVDGALAAAAATLAAQVGVIVEVDGALAAQAAALAGAVEVRIEADGALAAGASDLDGTVSVVVKVDAALAAQAATLAGTATTSSLTVDGALAAQAAALAAAVEVKISVDGALASGPAVLSATVTLTPPLAVNAALAAQPAMLNSVFRRIPPPSPEIRVRWNHKGTDYRVYVKRF
jgi:hypothetical protein